MTLPLKASRNEQLSVIRFLWAKGLYPNAIHHEMHTVYADSILQDQQYMFAVKSSLVNEKVLLM